MKGISRYAVRGLERARKSLLAAKLLLENDLFSDSVSRSYYAVLHSAKAALYMNGVESKTHEGVRKMFGLHLVKTGKIKIEKEFSDILTEEQEDRTISDYEVEIEINEERAKHRFDEAVKFVERIERYIRELCGETR